MDKKQHILNEIKRTAEKNGGKPLGKGSFFNETGIRESDWSGKRWNNWNGWGNAQEEAGYTRNRLQGAYDQDFLIQSLIALIRELSNFPLETELRREAARNKNFPATVTFRKRLGNKNEKIKKVLAFCRQNPDEYQDILEICEPLIVETVSDEDDFSGFKEKENESFGFVYLMKSGKHYKIGRTNSLDRRQYEIGMQLPEKIEPVHSIRTDDPSGIEAYWHNRFKEKHLNGEWFNLTASDVRIFKKRKFM